VVPTPLPPGGNLSDVERLAEAIAAN
jgi:hypothetical protein